MYASNSHSFTHLILALGIVREPTVWGFITSKYPGIHVIGLPTESPERGSGRAVVVLAGYKDKMKKLLHADPGLPRRFPEVVHLADLSPPQVAEVVRRRCFVWKHGEGERHQQYRIQYTDTQLDHFLI